MKENIFSKWFLYTIDYEYGIAQLYTRNRLDKPLSLFYTLAGDCFGIRKSIGETKLVNEELVEFTGEINTPKLSVEKIMKIGMGDYTSTMLHSMINRDHSFDIPSDKLEKAEFILAHSGDLIVFSKTEYDGGYWKIKSESGEEYCVCKKEGKPELKCEVHHYWVKNHDKKCKKHKN